MAGGDVGIWGGEKKECRHLFAACGFLVWMVGLFAAKAHVGRHFYQLAAYGLAYGVSTHGAVGVGAVGGLGKLYVLRVRADVVAKAEQGACSFHLVLDEHPYSVDAAAHVAVHFSEEGESRGFECFFVEVEVDVCAGFFAVEVPFKRSLSGCAMCGLGLAAPREQAEQQEKDWFHGGRLGAVFWAGCGKWARGRSVFGIFAETDAEYQRGCSDGDNVSVGDVCPFFVAENFVLEEGAGV